jgi:hypothetical protein
MQWLNQGVGENRNVFLNMDAKTGAAALKPGVSSVQPQLDDLDARLQKINEAFRLLPFDFWQEFHELIY